MSDTVEVTDEVAGKYEKGGGIPKAIRGAVVKKNRTKKLQRVEKVKEDVLAQRTSTDLFLEEFLRNGGNATKAAQAVFNVSSIESAAAMGSQYLKKARSLARVYLDSKGYGYGKMLDTAIKKMEVSEEPAWFDRLMKLAGYEDFLSKGGGAPGVVNIIQTQKTLQEEFGFTEGEVVKPKKDEKV
jgi:hypothetical protein